MGTLIPSDYLILDTRYKKRNDRYPLKIRVVYNRAAKDFKTGIDLKKEEFEQAYTDKPKSQFKELSVRLFAIKSRADKIIKDIGIFTFQKFEDAFYMRLKDASNVFPFFEEYIQLLKDEERIKTATSYSTAMNSFKAFKSKIGFYDIVQTFLKSTING